MDEKAIFEMKCGTTLHLQKVSSQVLKALTTQMFSAILNDSEKSERMLEIVQNKKDGEEFTNDEILSVFGAEVGVMAQMGEKLFIYCAGWGVTDDPPKRGIDEELLSLLGVSRKDKHRRRAEWVRSLLADEDEAQALIGAVQRLTAEG